MQFRYHFYLFAASDTSVLSELSESPILLPEVRTKGMAYQDRTPQEELR